MLKIKCLLRMTMLLSLVCTMLASCDREPCYKNDGKQVTWNTWDVWAGHHSIVVDADPSTFEDLGDGYARDGQQAFLDGNIIRGLTENLSNAWRNRMLSIATMFFIVTP